MTLDEAIQHSKEVAKKERDKLLKVGDEYICSECGKEHEQLVEWLEELKGYKGLEERGLLLKLPCKIGDYMYDINLNFNVITPIRIEDVIIYKRYNYFRPQDNEYSFQYNCCSFDAHGDVYEEYEISEDDINKTVFLTKEAAENELKRLKGEE